MSQADPETPEEKPRRLFRRLGVLGGIGAIAAIGAVIVVALQNVPEILARYVVRNYFQGLNIDTEGVDTLDIDPLAQEITFGPVRFGGGGTGEPALVGKLGLRFDITRLFQKRAMLNSVVIEGIRIDVRQTADGEILINGIPLRQLLAEQAAEAASPQAPVKQWQAESAPKPEEKSSWGAGLDSLRLRDSRVVFTDRRGGQATMTVNALDLDGFLSWTPDQPGVFRLDAELNGMRIDASGEATPFAENIGIKAKLGVSAIELAKVELYTGSLGFTRGSGTMGVTTDTNALLYPDGRIEAQLFGNVALHGLDLAAPGAGTVKLNEGRVTLEDAVINADTSGTLNVDGKFGMALDNTDLALVDGTGLRFAGASVLMADGQVTLPRDGPPAIRGRPQLSVQSIILAGPQISGTVGALDFRPSSLQVRPEGAKISIETAGPLDITAIDLTVPGAGEPLSVAAEKLHVDLNAFSLLSAGANVVVDGAVDLALDRLAVTKTAPGSQTGATALRLESKGLASRFASLHVASGKDEAEVKLAGELSLDLLKTATASANDPEAASLSANAVRIALPVLGVRHDQAGAAVEGAVSAEVQGLVGAARPPVGGGTQPSRINAESLMFDFTSFTLKALSGGTTEISGSGRTQGLRLRGQNPVRPGAPGIDLGLSQVSLDFSNLTLTAGEKDLAAKGQAKARLTGAKAESRRLARCMIGVR